MNLWPINKAQALLEDFRKTKARLIRLESALSELEKETHATRLLNEQLKSLIDKNDLWNGPIVGINDGRLYRPHLPPLWKAEHKFMEFSNCHAADFYADEFTEICRSLNHPPVFHRKIWEWVFVVHNLMKNGAFDGPKRGLGFGVGNERLPSLFSSWGAEVLATDAPQSIGADWVEGAQYCSELDQLFFSDVVQEEIFRNRVRFKPCDMNRIDDDLKGFDFTWSCCAFEHLGSIDAGIEFVINTVEKTLKPGGVAVHTTEFNMSSNTTTVDNESTVIFRKQDMERLIERLENSGHSVDTLKIAPDASVLDHFVDVPPYSQNLHLKMLLSGYVCTSLGIVIRKRA